MKARRCDWPQRVISTLRSGVSRGIVGVALVLWCALGTLPAGADDRLELRLSTGIETRLEAPAVDRALDLDGAVVLALDLAVPAFRWGRGILYDRNRWRWGLDLAVHPSVAEIGVRTVLEPMALFHFHAGVRAGTGWAVPLGGARIVGMATNPPRDAEPLRELETWQNYTLRGWVMPRLILDAEHFSLDPWARFVLELDARFEYQLLSTTAPILAGGEAWIWNNDAGMNFNGFAFAPAAFLGYRPPVIWGVEELGLVADLHTLLGEMRGSSPAPGGWGSDFWHVRYGLRTRVALSAWSRIYAEVYMRTFMRWTEESVRLHRYFGHRTLADPAGTSFGAAIGYRYEF